MYAYTRAFFFCWIDIQCWVLYQIIRKLQSIGGVLGYILNPEKVPTDQLSTRYMADLNHISEALDAFRYNWSYVPNRIYLAWPSHESQNPNCIDA
jgi:hypothetical protein